ncbi:hypothetical protein KOY48_04545 [Candidatus Minimicrobia naudis]|uniref:Uncharacterized protein n=1 Tax=Candidatus Minimicrobia naudis TaxID=2841263 RepID=A0A8F1SBK3_9BACT|nr:hypothetical protein KOY48_04545 [Candidatus Minimicrobia naudis]
MHINSGGYNRLPSNYFATKLSTGGSRSQTMCVITTEKRAYCWGLARFGQLGIGVVHVIVFMVMLLVLVTLEGVTDISQDGYTWSGSPGRLIYEYLSHTCAIASGRVYCWGGAGRGQSGSPPGGGGFGVYFEPSLSRWFSWGGATGVGVGISHSCALVDVCWY